MSYATQANLRLACRKIVFRPYCSSGPSTCCSSKAYDQPPGHGSEGLAIQISLGQCFCCDTVPPLAASVSIDADNPFARAMPATDYLHLDLSGAD
jgi:hypothetical protein